MREAGRDFVQFTLADANSAKSVVPVSKGLFQQKPRDLVLYGSAAKQQGNLLQ